VGDPSAARIDVRWPDGDELKKIRIGYFEDDGRTPVSAETRRAVHEAAEILRQAGLKVEPFRPQGLERARQLWWKLFGVAGGMLLRPMVRNRDSELSPILKEFLGWVAEETPHTAQTLLDTWIERDQVRIEVLSQMQRFPVLLCPVAAIPAFRHGERRWQIAGKTVEYLDAWSYSEWFNLLGMPAAAVPIEKPPPGLPVGVQVVAAPWREELVLSVAERIEQSSSAYKFPPIARINPSPEKKPTAGSARRS
jgi:Asp-tRNA(Asn)/Glu-tRNA(Gln) amidotransferase A subunit family amidase